MSAKDQFRREDKITSHQRQRQTKAQKSSTAMPRPALPTALQQSGLHSDAFTSRGVLQLQRTVGNQATQHLLAEVRSAPSPNSSPVVQRKILKQGIKKGENKEQDFLTLEELRKEAWATATEKRFEYAEGLLKDKEVYELEEARQNVHMGLEGWIKYNKGVVTIKEENRTVYLTTKSEVEKLAVALKTQGRPYEVVPLMDTSPDISGNMPGGPLKEELKNLLILNATRIGLVPADTDVIVNCVNGKTRTPIVYAVYQMIKSDLSADQAMKDVMEKYRIDRPGVYIDSPGGYDGVDKHKDLVGPKSNRQDLSDENAAVKEFLTKYQVSGNSVLAAIGKEVKTIQRPQATWYGLMKNFLEKQYAQQGLPKMVEAVTSQLPQKVNQEPIVKATLTLPPQQSMVLPQQSLVLPQQSLVLPQQSMVLPQQSLLPQQSMMLPQQSMEPEPMEESEQMEKPNLPTVALMLSDGTMIAGVVLSQQKNMYLIKDQFSSNHFMASQVGEGMYKAI